MDKIGKQINYCTQENCYAPYGKKPMRTYTVDGLCKYCRAHDEKISEELRGFEIEENQKEFKENPQPVNLSKHLDERTQELRSKRLERKEVSRQQKKKKPLRSLKKKTKKQSAIESEYRKVQSEILNKRKHCCEGCGRSDITITFSHRVSRKRRKDLITEKENIDLMCLKCHEFVEVGRWDKLLNGNQIKEYIKAIEPELYWLYFYKNNLDLKSA